MQVEIKIDPSQPEPKVVITAASMTEEVNRIVRRLSDEIPQAICGSGCTSWRSGSVPTSLSGSPIRRSSI